MGVRGPLCWLWILATILLVDCLTTPAARATGFVTAIRQTLELDQASRNGDEARWQAAVDAAAPMAAWVVDIAWRHALSDPSGDDLRESLPRFFERLDEIEPESARGAREVEAYYLGLGPSARVDIVALDNLLRRGWALAASRAGQPVVEIGEEVATRADAVGSAHARAEAEYLLGIGFLQQRDLERARPHLQRCHALALELANRWMAFISSVEWGDGEYHYGLAAEARAAYSRAHALQAGLPLAVRLYCLAGLGSTHAVMGDDEDAMRVFREAWELGVAQNGIGCQPDQMIELATYLVESLVAEGHPEEALAIGAEAERFYEAWKPDLYYRLQSILGWAEFEAGRWVEGLELTAGAVEALEGVGAPVLADTARQTLARLYVDAGFLHAALYHLHRIEAGFSTRSAHPVQRGRVHRDIGYVYELIDRPERARAHLEIARAAAIEAGSVGLMESARRHLGDLAGKTGGRPELEETLAWLREDIESLAPRARSLRWGLIGRTLSRLGRREEALVALRRGEALAADGFNRVRARINIASVLLDLERWDEADRSLKELIAEPAATTRYLAARLDELRAQLHEGRGEVLAALEAAERVTSRWEEMRQNLSRERDRLAFQDRVGQTAERILGLCLDHREQIPNALEHAFAAAERMRARTLLDGLRQGMAPGTDSKVISRALNAVTDARRRLRENKASLEARRDLQAARAELARAHEGALLKPGRFRGVRPARLEEARALAAEFDVEFVQYFVGRRRAFVFRIAPDGKVQLDELSAPAELRAWVGELRASLRDLDAFRDVFASSVRRLGQALLPGGPRHERVVVIPDGPLHHVPFDLLRFPSADGSGSYWLQRLTLSLAPSVSTLEALKASPEADTEATRPWLLIGQPAYSGDAATQVRTGPLAVPPRELRHAAREMEAIAEALDGKWVERLAGQAVTEAAFRAAVPRARGVHFVGHGHLDDFSALMSGLIVTPAGVDDGLITVAEVERMSLDADIVVLSACSTAEGHPERWEGLVGLTRAFLQAGARRVVSSLSGVEDATTARFMEHFYQEIARGRSYAEALREAKLAIFRSDEGDQMPLAWAAFTLFGMPR